ncbi:insulin-like peptide 4 precursor [Anopheles sinensis]|uniref:Insulin-like peptide 4 n=1 Tax=Anopheles sinensis TaxID=74873 RepID=A0A084WI09_ANOSI|nr:insulin-like peptide 4 precursor [Anopheles sinensis]
MVLLSRNPFAIVFWLVLAFGGSNIALSKSICNGELNSVFKVICAESPTIHDDNRNEMGHAMSLLDGSSNRFKDVPERGIVERNRRGGDGMRSKHECCERPCTFTELQTYCDEVAPGLEGLSISKQLCGTELSSVFSVICVSFPNMHNGKRNMIGHVRQIPNNPLSKMVWSGPSNSEEPDMEWNVANDWFPRMDGERSSPDGSHREDSAVRAVAVRNRRGDGNRMSNKHECCERECNKTELLSYCDEVAPDMESLSVSRRLCGRELTSFFSVFCVTFPSMHNGKRNMIAHARQIPINNLFPKKIWNDQYYSEETDVVPVATGHDLV